MPTEGTTTSPTGPDVKRLLLEPEGPFQPDLVRWRVTNTSNDKRRGQIVPYAEGAVICRWGSSYHCLSGASAELVPVLADVDRKSLVGLGKSWQRHDAEN